MQSCFPTSAMKEISISLHVSLWICLLLKCLYPAKITVSRVDSTKESHPHLSSPKITHTVTFFVSLNHILVLPFNLDFNPCSDVGFLDVCPRNFRPRFIPFSTSWRLDEADVFHFSLTLKDQEMEGVKETEKTKRKRQGDGDDKNCK